MNFSRESITVSRPAQTRVKPSITSCEHRSIDAKLYGTSRWLPGYFDVNAEKSGLSTNSRYAKN